MNVIMISMQINNYWSSINLWNHLSQSCTMMTSPTNANDWHLYINLRITDVNLLAQNNLYVNNYMKIIY